VDQPEANASNQVDKPILVSELGDFARWLVDCGAELHPPLTPNECLRYWLRAHGSSFVVLTKNGTFGFGGYANRHFKAFRAGASVVYVANSRDYETRTKQYLRLLDRDGEGCFYCGLPLGADNTIEHILSRSHGGPNHDENCALAHKDCNRAVDNLPVVAKMKMRDLFLMEAKRNPETFNAAKIVQQWDAEMADADNI